MEVVQTAKTTPESYAKLASQSADCEHIKCKLCQY